MVQYPGRDATPGTVLAFVALIQIFLVNISVPIAPGIYFIKVDISNSSDYLTAGLWGWCASIGGNATCSSPRIGYKIDTGQFSIKGLDLGILSNTFGQILGYLNLSHCIAGVFVLVIVCMGGIAHFRSIRYGTYLQKTAKFTVFPIAAISFALIIDLILWLTAMRTINKNDNVHARLGSAFWLMILTFVFMVFAALGFLAGQKFIDYRSKRAKLISHNPDMSGEAFLAQQRKEAEELKRNDNEAPEYIEFEEEVTAKGDAPPPTPPKTESPYPNPQMPSSSTNLTAFQTPPFSGSTTPHPPNSQSAFSSPSASISHNIYEGSHSSPDLTVNYQTQGYPPSGYPYPQSYNVYPQQQYPYPQEQQLYPQPQPYLQESEHVRSVSDVPPASVLQFNPYKQQQNGNVHEKGHTADF